MASKEPSAQRIDLLIRGMHCAGCVGSVESALRRTPGVRSATVNLATESAAVWVADAASGVEALRTAVKSAGYEAELAAPERPSAAEAARVRAAELSRQRRRLVFGLILGLPVIVPHIVHLVAWSASLFGVHWHAWSWSGAAGVSARIGWCVDGVLTAAVLGLVGGGILSGALRAVRYGAANMDLLVAIGALAAFAAGVGGVVSGAERLIWFADAAMIILFVSFGKYLEARSRGQASAALEALFERLPREAIRLTDDGEERAGIDSLRVGDRVRVAAHSQAPTDGEVVSGALSVDESMVTGEAAPVERGPGERVLGGTRAVDGLAIVRVIAVARESAVARIARLVEEAQAIKPKIQRLADRVAAIFVPVVLALSAATFVFWSWYGSDARSGVDWARALERAIAVLVVACPCAMGLAVPTAVLVGTTRAAELGVLVRDPGALESFGGIREVMLDKTGTLTLGRPKLERVTAANPMTDAAALRIAAALARDSEHPVSRAIVRAATERQIDAPPCEAFGSTPGAGVRGRVDGFNAFLGSAKWMTANGVDIAAWTERADALAARGHTVVWLASEPALAADRAAPVVNALIAVTDAIHPEAAAAIDSLHALGVLTRIVSGDRHAAVSHVADILGIREFEAELSPEAKLVRVRERTAAGLRTAFVGDGVNDAAALAAADVGVAIGAGADVAREASDICLLGHSPRLIPTAIRLSRASMRIMRQNLAWAFGYNIIMLPLAVFAPLPPAAATAAMMLSSFSVVANSLRLRRAV